MTSSLRFLGGVRTVTGSKFLIQSGGAHALVDCGLFQGIKDLRLRNWQPLGVDVEKIDAVVLTHAHLDHSGWIPRLVREGYRGPIYATPDTIALAAIVLPDSGHLQEEEAEFANRAGYSKHSPALALYTEAEARLCLDQFVPLEFGSVRSLAPGLEVRFARAGHILGAATAAVTVADGDGTTVVFSGDLGRPRHPLLVPPDPPPAADWFVLESTYGDRRHDDADAIERLADAIHRTARRRGTVVIPAFAVDRTEIILYHLRNLADAGELPEIPIYVDSPMALASLRVYCDALDRRAADVRPDIADGPDPFDVPGLVEIHDVEHSKAIDRRPGPAIIISASGMATGGRVVHHLSRFLPDRKNTVVLVGFQAEGTRGRALADGASELKMLGRYIPVRAEIVDLPAFSVHADQSELVDWMAQAPSRPDGVFIVHGDLQASEALRTSIVDRLDWFAVVPHQGERIRIDRG